MNPKTHSSMASLLSETHSAAFSAAACFDTKHLRVFRAQLDLMVAKGASWSEAEEALLQVIEHVRANPLKLRDIQGDHP